MANFATQRRKPLQMDSKHHGRVVNREPLLGNDRFFASTTSSLERKTSPTTKPHSLFTLVLVSSLEVINGNEFLERVFQTI